MTAQSVALGLRARYPMQAARAKARRNRKKAGAKTLILENVEMVPESGCWVWTGRLMRNGYANVRKNSYGQHLAHRASYEAFVGPIPNGLFVCHRCDVACCVNPDHLYVGSHADNMSDAVARRRMYHGKKTHCPAGHEYSVENTILRINKDTGEVRGRLCKVCRTAQNKARWQRDKNKQRRRTRA